MYNSEKIDKATKQIITGYIRKYKEYKQWYNKERDKLLFRKSLDNSIDIDVLEKEQKTRITKALENARANIGSRLEMMPEQAENLRLAIWISCMQPKRNTYEKLYARYLFPVSRRDFFRHKNAFFLNVKKELNL